MEVQEIINFLNGRIEHTESKQQEAIDRLNRTYEKIYHGEIKAYNDVLKFVLNHTQK